MTPTSEQQEAIYSDAANILCVSDAGSGKTGTLIERIFRLVRDGCHPENMVAITYTNSAAAEMADRLVPEDGSVCVVLGFVGTLHSFCLRHLQEFDGYADATVLDQEEADAELLRTAKDCNVSESLKKLKRMKAEYHKGGGLFSTRLVIGNYYRKLTAERLLDYDSILYMARDSLQHATLDKERSWEHLFVDEFQDASALDMEIYKAIRSRQRFYVGDPRQAIFGWRDGGSLDPFRELDASARWLKLTLSTNFRSGPEIVEAANRLISHATDLPETARQSVLKALQPLGDTQTGRISQSTVQARLWASDEAEASGIAEAIRSHAHQRRFESRGDYYDYAVLARTRQIANFIGDRLEQAGIPVRRKQKTRQPEEWLHAQAAVRALHLRTPDAVIRFLRIKDADYAEKLQAAGNRGEVDIIENTPFRKSGDLWSNLSELGVLPDTVERIGELWSELREKSLPNLALAMAEVKADEETVGDGVFVGTIHSAKGQEWDYVVLAGFEEGIIPNSYSDLDEERRIAYVGMTRARRGLWITCAAMRERGGPKLFARQLSQMEPSRFIAGAGLELEL